MHFQKTSFHVFVNIIELHRYMFSIDFINVDSKYILVFLVNEERYDTDTQQWYFYDGKSWVISRAYHFEWESGKGTLQKLSLHLLFTSTLLCSSVIQKMFFCIK